MIFGTKYWDKSTDENGKALFYVQDNNAVESILRKKLTDMENEAHELDPGLPHVPIRWLEDCGPTSCTNALLALGYDLTFHGQGVWEPRPADLVALWMNEPDNYPALNAVGAGVDVSTTMNNELMAFYPVAVKSLFNVNDCQFVASVDWSTIVDGLRKGNAWMICLKNPGHFLAVVAYDDSTDELIYNDPWPERTGTNGFNLRMKNAEFTANVIPAAVELW